MIPPSLKASELELVLSVLRQHPEIESATLFGSRAKGTHTPAVERKFEIISEALKQAAAEDPSIQQTITVLPSVIGLRNRIAHDYDQIDQEILWTTIELWLPSLKSQAKHLLDQYHSPDQHDA